MAEALHSSGFGGGGMAALGGASSRCLAQISQLLEAIDLPCDPRRKPQEPERTVRVRVRVRVRVSPNPNPNPNPNEQERTHAPDAGRQLSWARTSNSSSREPSFSRQEWSPSPGRNPSFSRRDDIPSFSGRDGIERPTPPYVGGGSGRFLEGSDGGASRTPRTAPPPPARAGCRSQHARRGDAQLEHSAGGGCGGDGSGGDAGDLGGSRDSRVTFAGKSLGQVSEGSK